MTDKKDLGGTARLFDYGALFLASVVVIMRPSFSGMGENFFSNMIVILFIYAAFALWIFGMLLRRRITLYKTGIGTFILLFLLALLLAYLQSSYRRAGLEHVINFFSYALLFYIVFDMCVRKKLSRYFLLLLLATCLITAIYGVYQYFVYFPEMKAFLETKPYSDLTIFGIGANLLPEVESRIRSREVFSTFVLSSSSPFSSDSSSKP